ncbi:LysR family transcriptional regulator [Novosphingobium flavum]|uniref:LysR family transcriptional regulator n=1 Tax=Novosphingobium flavum TaxID=1778672 RepID=A0A7X1KLY5_9SPHN|nr:LysR substrate-binding domain-containing protein [Novosphingobium flavum]MBC2666074.1 LysR family transcriptional regulator [Novosphingobium flavum]
MTLNQLRTLLAIADAELNISLAAARLNATQPALSRQLRQIEEELGFQVFVRHGKSLAQITRAGGEVLARARAVLGEVRNIEALAANHRRETRGTLRVATTQALGRFVLPAALGRLRARFGAVQLRLRPGGGEECLDLLERDEIDLALVSTEGERPAGDVALPLFRWNRALVALPGHPLAGGNAPLSLTQIAQYPLIAADTATQADFKMGRAFREAGIEPNIACTARDADTIKTFVRLDLGIGIVAEMALTPEDEDLVRLPAAHVFPGCITWAILRSDRIQRDYVFELLRELAPTLSREEIDRVIHGERGLDLTSRIAHWAA